MCALTKVKRGLTKAATASRLARWGLMVVKGAAILSPAILSCYPIRLSCPAILSCYPVNGRKRMRLSYPAILSYPISLLPYPILYPLSFTRYPSPAILYPLSFTRYPISLWPSSCPISYPISYPTSSHSSGGNVF